MATKADPDAIVADIRRVAEELGEPPSTDQYREHGKYTVPTVYNHFDGFVAAREQAGVAEGQLRPNSREELLNDIRRVSELVGGEPSWDEYVEHGDYAIKGITYRFDTWNEAKQEAGVYERENHEVTPAMLIEDMQRVDAEQSGALSQVTYDEYGKWTSMAVKRTFESWESACQQAGVTRSNKGPRTEESEELLEDIREVADELGRLPFRSEYNEMGEFSRQMAINRFGSWGQAVLEAGFEPNEPGAQPGEVHPLWEGGTYNYYGPNWMKRKREIRARDGECMLCGVSQEEHIEEMGERLSVHHIVRFEEFEDYKVANRRENLIALCRSCHSQIDEHDSQTREKLRKLVGSERG